MGAYNTQPKNVGSAYFNTKKGTSQAINDEVAGAIQFLKDNNVYISISMRDNNGGYEKFSAFFNGFKDPNKKDPDLIIRMSEVAVRPRPQASPQRRYNAPEPQAPQFAPKGKFAAKKAPVARKSQTNDETDSFGGDEVPFA